MADPQTANTLRRKRYEIESAIGANRAKIEEAERSNISAISAMRRFSAPNGEVEEFPAHLAMGRYFNPRHRIRVSGD